MRDAKTSRMLISIRIEYMTKLEIAKKIIKEYYRYATCGIFNCPNIISEKMYIIYNEKGLKISICYSHSYFEVFGLNDTEFKDLYSYYDQLLLE